MIVIKLHDTQSTFEQAPSVGVFAVKDMIISSHWVEEDSKDPLHRIRETLFFIIQ